MTEMLKNITGAPSASSLTWKTIDWNHVTIEVKQLQMRIAKTVREKRYGKSENSAMALNTLIFCQAFGSEASDSKFRG